MRSGHLPTLLTAFLYFDLCFAVWVLNAAVAPFISEELALSPAEKGLLLSVPVFAGALLRFPLGLWSQVIGRKRSALVQMGVIALGLASGWLLVDSFASVLVMGLVLGVAGASFGVALSLGSGWYPPRYKGLAMGIAGAGNSGAVLAMLFAPPLARAFGWKAVYGLSVLPLLVAMALLWLLAKEPPDREHKSMRDYLRVLVDRDAWVFNLVYAVTFGGYIGLTSFLPTLFHDQYGIPRQSVGQYAAIIVVAASVLRVGGGWLADRVGGLRLLYGLLAVVAATMAAAATMPREPWALVIVLVLAFSAMGAGNGAVFQLVPLRFRGETSVASSLIGEIGGLAGGLLPAVMGLGRAWTGSFALGFGFLIMLTVIGTLALMRVAVQWQSSWLAAGGRAREGAPEGAHERQGEGAREVPAASPSGNLASGAAAAAVEA